MNPVFVASQKTKKKNWTDRVMGMLNVAQVDVKWNCLQLSPESQNTMGIRESGEEV
jgi:hypothetical protein